MPSSLATSLSGSTSSSLLAGVRARDPVAWRRFADLYGPAVYHWCRKSGLQPADAADVAQEVFRAVLSAIERFRGDEPGSTFRGWLWTIAQNKLRDHWRRQGKEPPAVGGSSLPDQYRLQARDERSSASDFHPDPLSALPRRALAQLQSQFGPHTWQAFWRLAIEGHSAADIGRDLGLSAAAVRQAKFRVLKRLRSELEGLDS